MSNKSYKAKKAQRQRERQQQEQVSKRNENARKLLKVMPIVIIVVLMVSLFGFGVIHLPAYKTPFSIPSSTVWGGGEQVSDSYVTGNLTVYYFSWYGCPYGATDSWAFYEAVSSYTNSTTINNHITLHTSSSTDVYPSTPGMLFSPFVSGNLHFVPVYVYNQTMTGTPNNQPISQSDLVGAGIYEINQSVPASIAQLEYHYMIQVPIQGSSSSSFYNFQVPHVNTNIIVAGPHGAWVFDGPIYNPSVLAGLSPSYVYSHLSSIGIGGVSSIINAFKTVGGA